MANVDIQKVADLARQVEEITAKHNLLARDFSELQKIIRKVSPQAAKLLDS